MENNFEFKVAICDLKRNHDRFLIVDNNVKNKTMEFTK